MRRYAALTVGLLLCSSAHADWFYRFVGYTCDTRRDQLVVHHRGASNEVGEAMRAERRINEWEPDSLIATMKDDDHIGTLKTVRRTCKLKHATYSIRIGPTPGNYNIQGRCGAVVTAWVQVKRGSRLVLPRHELEGDCHDTESLVTTEIVFNSRSSQPAVKKLSQEEFAK